LIKNYTFKYQNLAYAIDPAVNGLVLTMPAAAANINGQHVNLQETPIDISANVAEGDYTVYITPDGYALEVSRPDGTIENARTVFPDTGSAYWVCSFHLEGTETDLNNVDIAVLHAEEVSS